MTKREQKKRRKKIFRNPIDIAGLDCCSAYWNDFQAGQSGKSRGAGARESLGLECSNGFVIEMMQEIEFGWRQDESVGHRILLWSNVDLEPRPPERKYLAPGLFVWVSQESFRSWVLLALFTAQTSA